MRRQQSRVDSIPKLSGIQIPHQIVRKELISQIPAVIKHTVWPIQIHFADEIPTIKFPAGLQSDGAARERAKCPKKNMIDRNYDRPEKSWRCCLTIASCGIFWTNLRKAKLSGLFIGTQFRNLYTAVDTPAKDRVGVCVVFVCLVFACKCVLGHSRVSQPPNSGYASSCTSDGGTLAFSLRSIPPKPATDDALTHSGSSAALRPAPLPSHGPIPFTFPPRPDLH